MYCTACPLYAYMASLYCAHDKKERKGLDNAALNWLSPRVARLALSPSNPACRTEARCERDLSRYETHC